MEGYRRASIGPEAGGTGTPSPAISAKGLRKSFGGHIVLDGINLAVAEGTIFSLLGANKTTMVRILSAPIGADGGETRVVGHDVARVIMLVGFFWSRALFNRDPSL